MEHQAMEDRVAKLERELSRVRRRAKLAVVAGLCGIAIGAMALAARWLPSRQVRTARLELVDGLGRTRATLENTEAGPALTLRGDDEGTRARLGMTGQLASLSLLDAEGAERVLLGARQGLLVTDGERSRLSLGVTSDGPALELVGTRGFATLHPLDGLKLFGGGGALAAALSPGALSLYEVSEAADAQLSILMSAPRRPGERARLLLYDQADQPTFRAP